VRFSFCRLSARGRGPAPTEAATQTPPTVSETRARHGLPFAHAELPRACVRVEGKQFLVRKADGSFSPFFVKGIDIGAAKPGFWPGEFGIEESDYLRWFQWIGEMNANTIRVYVPLMPGFYHALLTYNLSASVRCICCRASI
jgi:hypothetical protein